MEATRQRWTAGDHIVVRATRCTVTRVERMRDCDALELRPHGIPDAPFGTLLAPFDRPRRIATVPTLHAVRPRRWLHAVRRAASQQRPFGALGRAADTRIDILPYQLEPALAMLRHACLRVLLADAVGLGKTIQAGLVLAEALAESPSRRALVIVPAGLRHQWHSELTLHFGIEPAVCDAGWLRCRTRDLPSDVNPWALPGAYVVSLDFVKQPEVLRPLEDLLWDLVVVDEAHLVTTGTDRRAAVDAIAARARRVLLLTGTPHSGDGAQFDALCRLGEGADRTPLVMFRRGRHDVGAHAARRSVLLRVRPSPAERRMHELLERYTSRLWHESQARGDRVARLVAIVLRKRALSSAGSLAASLARRIDLLAATNREGARQLALPLDEREEEIDDEVRDAVLGAPGLANAALERRWLGTLLETARYAAADERKVARLRRYLSRIHEPAVVFTEYRDTLARLHRRLQRHSLPVLTLHGGMRDAERRAVQRAFNEEDCLLLATDAAAEGLNLQHRCRVVVHFELPWNPLRLEQRAGRVDRIGQGRRVHEMALVADDTAERLVLAPLARRARTAMDVAPGGGRMLQLLSDMRVAEAVMAGTPDPLADMPRASIRCPEPRLGAEAAAEAGRLEQERRWRASRLDTRRGEEDGVSVAALRRARRTGVRHVTLVYTLSLEAGAGESVHAEPLVLRLAGRLGNRVRGAADAIREAQRAICESEAAIEHLIEARLTVAAETVAPLHHARVVALRRREAAIGELRTSPAGEPVQAGLFDRRALRQADERLAADRLRRADAEARLEDLASAAALRRRVSLHAALLDAGELP